MSQVFSDIKQVDLTPLKCYQLYNSIKLHFSSKRFDYKKYGLNAGKFNQKTFDEHRSKDMFVKISDKFLYQERFIPFLVANSYSNPSMWIGDMMLESNVKKALEFRKYLNSFKESFTNDIQMLVGELKINNINVLYDVNSRNNYFNLLVKNKIKPFTAAVLNNLFYTKYCSNTSLSFIYEDKAFYLNRLLDFVPKECYNTEMNGEYLRVIQECIETFSIT